MVQMALRDTTAGSRLEQNFWEYHFGHPEVYQMLVQFAQEWRERRGSESTGGMKMLWERVRWEMAIQSSGTFKCNNNHHPFYARLLMDRNPDLEGIFNLRKQRVQATIGPDNSTLTNGEHSYAY